MSGSAAARPVTDEAGAPAAPAGARAVRADAKRNREKLLAAAGQVFSGQDAADASLEAIARQAGVGIGTLYRHFPTRLDLLEAVYRNEVESLTSGVDELLADNPPDVALAVWMQRFVGLVAVKRGLAAAMKEVVAADSEVFAYCHGLVREAISRLVAAAVDTGAIRADADPHDLMRAMIGVCSVGDQAGWQDRAVRLIGLLIDGLRYRAPAPR